jgi:hypothetical protein
VTERLRVGDLPDEFVLYKTFGYTQTSRGLRVLHLEETCPCFPEGVAMQSTQAAARYDDSVICRWCLFRSEEYRPDMTHPAREVE